MTIIFAKGIIKQLSSVQKTYQRGRLTTTTSRRRIGSLPFEIVPIAEEHINHVHNDNNDERIASSLRPHYQQKNPVVLRGAVAQDLAIRNWQSLEYLREAVPPNEVGCVEIGGTYGNPSMERPEIPFDDYLHYLELFHDRHGVFGPELEGGIDPWLGMGGSENEPTPHELVYMAQNDLFPSLYKDVTIPAFCDNSAYGIGRGKLYSTMLWLGPRGCVSPLHYDPLDNVLMQFVGRKRILLFEASSTKAGNGDHSIPWHYAGSEGQQYNTSPVNVEDSLETLQTSHPLFCEAAPPAIYCILNPGDALYIPAKWWHHVRSLDTSASVNVWWR